MLTVHSFRFSGTAAAVMVIACCCWMLAACSNKDDDPKPGDQYNISATMNAAQEVANPPVNSTATGSITGTYNSTTYKLTYTMSWSNLTAAPTAMHFHGPAPAGENAGVALGITGFPANATGSVSGEATLTAQQGADLMAGKWYGNIHTPTYGGGEIRGQVAVSQ